MKIKRRRSFQDIVWYCSDDDHLFVLHPNVSFYDLVSVDGETFSLNKSIKIFYNPNKIVTPIVHDRLMYLPAVDGRIITIDVQNFERFSNIDLGPMMLVSPFLIENVIYSICAVPISNRPTTDTDISVVCVNDKNTGQKKYQSSVLKGRMSPIAKNRYSIFLSHDKTLCKFSLNCELEAKTQTSFHQSYPAFFGPDSVLIFSSHGSIEIFNEELQPKNKRIAHSSKCSPVEFRGSIYWPTAGHLFKIDETTGAPTSIFDFPFTPIGKPVIIGDKIYTACSEGSLLEFDVYNKNYSSLHIGQALRQPVVSHDFLFIQSNKEMVQICLNTP